MAIGIAKYGSVENGKPMGLEYEISYEGCVIETRERSGYDDSDFYALVWDDIKKCIRSVDYATTRAYTYDNYASVDITPELMEKVNRWCAARNFYRLRRADKDKAAFPDKGKWVRVISGKKVPIGTEGILFWIGEWMRFNYYSKDCRRVGIALDEEKETITKVGRKGTEYEVERYKNVVWTYDYNLEVVNPEQYYTPKRDLLRRALQDPYSQWSAHRLIPGYQVM